MCSSDLSSIRRTLFVMSVNKARRRPASSARPGAVRVKERLQEPLLHAEGAKRLDPKTVPTAFIAGGRKPRIILMAALGRVYAALEYRKIEAVIPPLRSPHRKGAQGFGTERFKFDPRHDVVRCPAKKRLTPPATARNPASGIEPTGAIARAALSRRNACPRARHPAGCIS